MITFLSGTLWFGIGKSFDESKLTPYTAGTFSTEPRGSRTSHSPGTSRSCRYSPLIRAGWTTQSCE